MEVGNQSTKHWHMDTPCSIKEMKVKSIQTKFIIKNIHISICVWDFTKIRATRSIVMCDMSSTNANNLHAHEVARSLWVWTPIVPKSSSSSYIQSMKKITLFFSFLSFRRQSWSSSCLSYMSLFEFVFVLLLLLSCSKRLCVNYFFIC